MLFGTTYELSLNKTYVRHWGVLEAVRELIQNALDSESPFVFEFTRGEDDLTTLTLTSANAVLSAKSLLLGATTKAEDPDKIGSFGEGYKIALLVLTREDRYVRVLNGPKVWRPFFRYSKRFDDELLCIEETSAEVRREGLAFVVGGLTDEDEAGIRASCLQMQSDVGEVHTVSQGQILLQKPGLLYVGGLFICKTELKYGYNIDPKHIALERDRKTVDNFNLKYLTKDMWYETERFDDIAKMIEAEVPDLEYARFSSPQMVKEACFRLFQSKHPGKAVAESQAELQEMVKRGMTTYVYSGGAFGAVVKSSPSYRNMPRAMPPRPHDKLSDWYSEAKYHMHASVRPGFERLLAESTNWICK